MALLVPNSSPGPEEPNNEPKCSAVVSISAARPTSPLSSTQLLQLSWSRLIELVRISDPMKRAFYEDNCLRDNWSLLELRRQIGSLLYERTGLSTDKAFVISHAREQSSRGDTTSSVTMADIIRDPYVLEFTGLPERTHYLESDLEKALLDHLQQFLLELGTGFCFEARQRRITLDDEHDHIDLVFYHRILRCHLLIDLKVRAFQHGDAGQMNYYLNWWKDNVTAEGDIAPVGLILCSDKRQAKVEYATAGMDQNLFVSRYLLTLPQPEALQHLLEQDRAHLEQQSETDQ
jgi:predicted nuclease of restriction endonuclease-like (RecB) superfamily